MRADGPQAFGSYEGVNAKATYPLWELIRARQSAFSGMFAWGDAGFLVGRGAEARSARGLWVSGDFFPVLGIRARTWTPARRLTTIVEDAAPDRRWSVTRSGRRTWAVASPP